MNFALLKNYFRQMWRPIATLAVLYFICGKLGLLLAIPPGYATAVWPPSGIAVALLLVFGVRAWPGVWAGSFLVNVSTSFDASNARTMLISSLIATIIGAGASVQAGVGAKLGRAEKTDRTSLLFEPRLLFRLLAIAGPISCAVNAMVGVFTLYHAQLIHDGELLFSLWTWWIGDVIGVLVFCPVVLLLADPVERKRSLRIILPLSVSFAFVVTIFIRTSDQENQRIRANFEQSAADFGRVLEHDFAQYTEVLRGMERFLVSSETVTREEFRIFVEKSLARYPGIRALSWNPVVSSAERSHFEDTLKKEMPGLLGITERDIAGNLVNAPDRDLYTPVYLIEPVSSNANVIGVNVYGLPDRATAIDRAAQSRDLSATEPLMLIQNKEAQPAILIFHAVFSQEISSRVRGYVAGAFEIKQVANLARQTARLGSIAVEIRDASTPTDKPALYSSRTPDNAVVLDVPTNALLHHGIAVSVAGRTWNIGFTAPPEFTTEHRSLQAWSILAGGLIFTGLLGLFLLTVAGYTSKVSAANEKLRISSTRYSSLVLASSDIIWTNSAEGKMEGVQEPWGNFTGQSPGDYQGYGWLEAIHPEDRSSTLETWNRSVADSSICSLQHRVRDHQGKYRYFAVKAVPIFDFTGALVEWVGAHTDITEQRIAQQRMETISQELEVTVQQRTRSLEQTQKFLRKLMDNLPVAVFVKYASGDRYGTFRFFNKCSEMLFGVNATHVEGKNDYDLFSKEQADRFVCDDKRVFDLNEPVERSHEEIDSHTMGRRILRTVRIPLLDEGGDPEYLLGFSEDITEKVAAERELKAANQRLHFHMNSSPLAVMEWAPDLSIKFWSNGAEGIFGWQREEVEGRKFEEDFKFYFDEDREAIQEVVAQLLTGQRRQVISSNRNYRKDGSTVECEWYSSSLLDEAGDVVSVLSLALDLSEYRVTEKALQRQTIELEQSRLAAEKATEAKSHFLANMSHEIRTPLTAIIGYAEALSYGDYTVSQLHEALTPILANSGHLLNLVNDILDFSKIEAGKLEIDLQEVDLIDLTDAVSSTIEPKAKEKDLEFGFDFLYPLPRIIVSDPTRLRQILINLVGNAIKFTMRGSVRVRISLGEDNESLVFAVADTGIGLTEEEQKKLFKAFVQADTSTTRKFGGTGLGLVISNELAVRLGGHIELKSKKEYGSTFTLSLKIGPVDRNNLFYCRPKNSPSEQIHPEHVGSSVLQGCSILLVEDGIDNQRLISNLLSRVGAKVHICEDGLSAVQQATGESFDLILMDMQMPLLGGLEATKLLRSAGYSRPIVALTANVSVEDQQHSRNSGCDDHIPKPFERQRFLATVAKHVKRTVSSDSNVSAIAPKAVPRLKSLLDDPETRVIVQGFIARLPDMASEMRTMCEGGRLSEVRALAHKMKGTAANFGLFQLQLAAKEVEELTKAGNSIALSEKLVVLDNLACGANLQVFGEP